MLWKKRGCKTEEEKEGQGECGKPRLDEKEQSGKQKGETSTLLCRGEAALLPPICWWYHLSQLDRLSRQVLDWTVKPDC